MQSVRGKSQDAAWLRGAGVDPLEFAPALVRLAQHSPSPLGRATLYAVLLLVSATVAWAALSHVDVIAVADGKLVPATYLKIVQPAENGVVKDILVSEGQAVRAGQVLARMDTSNSEADGRALESEYHARRLAARRVEAQLAGRALERSAGDPEVQFVQANGQYQANVAAYQSALAQERAVLERARHERSAAREVRAKLVEVLPHYRAQERAFDKLARDGFAGRLMATDKTRERIEKERDLRAQDALIASASASIEQSTRRLAQIEADYRRALQGERVEIEAQLERLSQARAKQRHRAGLLELRAPQAGVVKDLATHTPGTVVSPGTILMTLVPADEPLRAEVWIANDDVGFVRPGHPVRLKLAPYPFQKYGMLDGEVAQLSADASDATGRGGAAQSRDRPIAPLAFRAIVRLREQVLASDGRRHALVPGMQVVAEIRLGERTILEYLLSPMQKAWHEAGRER